MSIIKKILLAILSIILIIDINLIVFAISVNETILNPGFVEYEIGKFGVYTKIKETILGNFEENELFVKIINESVTEEWIKNQSQSLIYNFFTYIKSNKDEMDLTISVSEVKRNMESNTQREIANPVYAIYIKNEIEKFPDNIDLYDNLDNNAKETLKNMQMAVDYFYLVFYLLIAIAVVIPILSIIIARNLKSVIRFIGNSAFMSGLISYGTGILTIDMLSRKFQNGEMPETIPRDIVLPILRDMFGPVKTYGLILFIFGAVLLIISFFIKDKNK